jgi:hypothetical protein
VEPHLNQLENMLGAVGLANVRQNIISIVGADI